MRDSKPALHFGCREPTCVDRPSSEDPMTSHNAPRYQPLPVVVAAAIGLALGSPARVLAQEEEPTGWTPELQMQYRGIAGTAVSPDGSLIAYVVREPVMEGEKSEYLSHIWLASADASSNRQFTRGEKSASSPSFSPDGSLLAFSSSRSDENQVWVMPVSGGEAWQVTDSDNGVGSWA